MYIKFFFLSSLAAPPKHVQTLALVSWKVFFVITASVHSSAVSLKVSLQVTIITKMSTTETWNTRSYETFLAALHWRFLLFVLLRPIMSARSAYLVAICKRKSLSLSHIVCEKLSDYNLSDSITVFTQIKLISKLVGFGPGLQSYKWLKFRI